MIHNNTNMTENTVFKDRKYKHQDHKVKKEKS